MIRRLLTILIVAIAGFSFVASDVDVSYAQWQRKQVQKQKREGFFSRLFGPREEVRRPPDRLNIFKKKRKAPTVKAKKRTPSRPARRQEAPVETAVVDPKDPNARKILVVGDFAAGGLAWGLDQALAKEPMLKVIDKSNSSSGLVRTDNFDWNKQLTEILNAEQPDIVVAMFGANDRQQIKLGNQRLAIRSEPWEKTYGQRVESILETLKVYGRPYFWVSAPPVRTTAVSADMAYLNGLYKPRVEALGGYFVDIWIGFTNENGTYISTGPDIEGQTRALRTPDGINFTRAGRQKLAFYVERDIRRKTGTGTGGISLLASTDQRSQIEVGPDGKKRLVGPVISLSDPLPGASDTLAGAPPERTYDPITGIVTEPPVDAGPKPEPANDSLRYRVIVKGESAPPTAGRVDDFAWPPGRPEARAAPPTAPAVAATSSVNEPVLTPTPRPN